MRNVRVWFTKLGRAKYISHLDINRCMTRAVRRARLPLWYTEGYNPHPYMTFSLPLPLGVESLCESMDIRIENDSFSNQQVQEQLAAVMPEGLAVTGVNDSVRKAREIAFADYQMTVSVPSDARRAASAVQTALDSQKLLAEKKSKSGHKKVIKTVDLYPCIQSAQVFATDMGTVQLEMILAAGPVQNVNPILMLDTILKKAELTPEETYILRRRLLTGDMEEFR